MLETVPPLRSPLCECSTRCGESLTCLASLPTRSSVTSCRSEAAASWRSLKETAISFPSCSAVGSGSSTAALAVKTASSRWKGSLPRRQLPWSKRRRTASCLAESTKLMGASFPWASSAHSSTGPAADQPPGAQAQEGLCGTTNAESSRPHSLVKQQDAPVEHAQDLRAGRCLGLQDPCILGVRSSTSACSQSQPPPKGSATARGRGLGSSRT